MPKRRELDYGAPTVEHLVSYDEAVSMLKARRFIHRYVMLGTWNPHKVNELHGSRSSGGYVAACGLKVSKAQALKFMKDAYPEHVRCKINVNVTTADGFIWVGRSP